MGSLPPPAYAGGFKFGKYEKIKVTQARNDMKLLSKHL